MRDRKKQLKAKFKPQSKKSKAKQVSDSEEEQEHEDEEQEEAKRLKLLTWGADKTIIYRNIESPEIISIYHKEVPKNKIVAMEAQGTKVLTGHDKLVSVTDLRTYAKLYEK